MKKKILVALGGVGLLIASILLLPYCDGDCGYMIVTIPFGLAMIFGQKHLDL